MNKILLIGRLVKDVEAKTTSGDKQLLKNTLAISRKYKSANGERETDFLDIVAFGNTAKLIHEHFKKGDRIGIEGTLVTSMYEKKDGTKIKNVEIIVEGIDFLQDKKVEEPNPYTQDTRYEINNSDLPF